LGGRSLGHAIQKVSFRLSKRSQRIKKYFSPAVTQTRIGKGKKQKYGRVERDEFKGVSVPIIERGGGPAKRKISAGNLKHRLDSELYEEASRVRIRKGGRGNTKD